MANKYHWAPAMAFGSQGDQRLVMGMTIFYSYFAHTYGSLIKENLTQVHGGTTVNINSRVAKSLDAIVTCLVGS